MNQHQILLTLAETLAVAHRLLLALGEDYDDMYADVGEMLDAVGSDARMADPALVAQGKEHRVPNPGGGRSSRPEGTR